MSNVTKFIARLMFIVTYIFRSARNAENGKIYGYKFTIDRQFIIVYTAQIACNMLGAYMLYIIITIMYTVYTQHSDNNYFRSPSVVVIV